MEKKERKGNPAPISDLYGCRVKKIPEKSGGQTPILVPSTTLPFGTLPTFKNGKL